MKIQGIYKKTLFRDEVSGYTIFTLKLRMPKGHPENGAICTCKGKILHYASGHPLSLEGNYKEKDNRQFFAVESAENLVDGTEMFVSYLSASINGIGKKTAEEIAKILLPDYQKALKDEEIIKKLCKVKRMNKEKAEAVIETLSASEIQKEIFDILISCGGSTSSVMKLYKAYGNSAIERLKEDTYRICQETGIPFFVADSIAHAYHLPFFDERRVEAVIMQALFMAEEEGHTRITFDKLTENARKIEKESVYEEIIPDMMLLSVANNADSVIVKKEDDYHIYRKASYQAEMNIVGHLDRIEKSKELFPYKEQYVDDAQEHASMLIIDEQRQAFDILKGSGVKFLVGGPGRGKTTLIREFIYLYEKMFPKKEIVLCAPTGRASQRMTEMTGKKAYTMHKIMEYRPFDGGFLMKDKNNPIKAGLIIVDEFSMVDTFLFSMFLDAVENGTLLLLVGDKNQLPSVGPGNVLKDILDSGRYETHELTKIYRQSENSVIITNSDKILDVDLSIDSGSDFEFRQFSNEKQLENAIVNDFVSIYDRNDKMKCQILTTTKKGLCGTKNLNKKIQSRIFGDIEKSGNYFVDDKIMMLRNNYGAKGEHSDGYFNGDMGYVTDIAGSTVTVTLGEGEDKDSFCISSEDMQDITLSYAMTVHKSQGSEYDIVFVVMPRYPEMLLFNNIIYTAITRGKKVVIYSEDMAFYEAILKKEEKKRDTGLYYKLTEKQAI